MAELGVGIVGCGGMGAALAKGLGEVDCARVVAVFDEAAAKAQELAASTGGRACASYEDLLADDGVQAVVVASPQFAHAEHAVAAAEGGKHVFCEKPMAMDLDECDAMMHACRAAGVKLMIGQVCRYHGVHGKVRDMVASGEFGEPVCMTVHRLGVAWGDQWNQHWRLKKGLSGGTLLEINAHEIDFMRWVCGDVVQVYGAGGQFLDDRLDYPDLVMVTLHFASGAKGLLHAGQVSVIGGYGGRVDCERGSIVFPAIWGEGAGIRSQKQGEEEAFLPVDDIVVETPVTHELRDFVQCILDDAPAPIPGEEGRAAVEIGIAAYQSIQTGLPVALPLQE